MKIRKGVPVTPGYAIGPAVFLASETIHIQERTVPVAQIPAEIQRFGRAFQGAKAEIESIEKRAGLKFADGHRTIFQAHLKMLEEMKFEIARNIKDNRWAAEYSVTRTLKPYIKSFQDIGDDFFSQRVTDVRDIEQRLLRHLVGGAREAPANLPAGGIVIAADLTPSEVASLEHRPIAALVTEAGGRSSHTAIVARAMDIPVVVGLQAITADLSAGETVIVDGNEGVVILQPDAATLKDYRARLKKFQAFAKGLIALRDLPAETLDGTPVTLMANIEFPEGVHPALVHGATGIGLYRTEFLFLSRDRAPTEEEHLESYAQVIRQMGGRPVTIRTLDLGGDKANAEMAAFKEPNPALGCRSIRYCFQRLDLFKTQLRAILRASAFGPVRIMFPMIGSIEEMRRAKAVLEEVREELKKERVPVAPAIPVGCMIEVPAAALHADILAKESDFFSIGTNDLIQYALAVDRRNERVAYLYSPAHPAILRLLKSVREAAAAKGIPVAICGEMGGDAKFTVVLVGIGITEFSLSPALIPEMKKIIRSIRRSEAEEVARKAFTFHSAEETMAYLTGVTRRILPELFV